MSCAHKRFASQAASNESSYWPEICSDKAFLAWALRVSIRLVNLPSPRPERLMRRAIFKDFTPNPEWAEGLAFMLAMSKVRTAQNRCDLSNCE